MGDSSTRRVVGIDVGGTSVKAALVSGEYEVLANAHVPTDVKSQDGLLDSIADLVRQVADGAELSGVGFGLPSEIDQRSGRVVDSINVPIVDVPFAHEMHRRLGVPIRVDNDANVACLAEARMGAARGADHVVMFTLGTGVGGGLLIDGELFHGANGYGAELGHMVIDENGPRCQGHCPNHGCLEALASASGVEYAARQVAAEDPGGGLAALLGGGTAPDTRHVIDRALAGDGDCIEVLARVGRHLGVAISNCVNVFNPEVVVIGGGISIAGDLVLGPARVEAGMRALRPNWSVTTVVPAELGNAAGVLGAAALVV
ncbi:MAG: ROK family protein [Gaiellales bacterium]